jgi:polyisoprenoid-binding protein YceI
MSSISSIRSRPEGLLRLAVLGALAVSAAGGLLHLAGRDPLKALPVLPLCPFKFLTDRGGAAAPGSGGGAAILGRAAVCGYPLIPGRAGPERFGKGRSVSGGIMNKYFVSALLLAGLTSAASAATYDIDTTHSAITFKVAHMAISKVSGRFDKFTGSLDFVPGDTKAWKVDAKIETASINTNMPARDEHLRAPDFFDAAQFPAITFKSLKVTNYKNMKGKLHGELTMRGVTRPVVMEVEGSGPATDPWGNERLGAVARTSINRKDFGLTWNKALETGGLLVGEKVEIEAVKRKPAEPPAK